MNPYLIIGLLLAWLASVAGVGYWQNEAGRTVELAKWEAQKNAEIDAANKTLHDTEESYRAKEHADADVLAAVSTTYEGRIKDEQTKTTKLVADARAGVIRLYDRNAPSHSPIGHTLSETPSSPGGCDGAGDGGLSTVTTGDLLGLTGRCNLVRDQLTACQAVITADRAQ